MIKTFQELIQAWPAGSIQIVGGEIKGPCPFCNGDEGEIHWEGTDRFHIYKDGKGGYCRFCALAGRGNYFSLAKVARRLGFEIDENLQYAALDIEEKPLQNLWTVTEVEQSHQKVDYHWWWTEYAWGKELVDKFQLGMGRLYDRWGRDYHVIPMKGLIKPDEAAIENYYIAARYRRDGKKIKERSPGSSKQYLWLYEENLANKQIALVEGDTDGITANLLGFKNFAATFGATTWTSEKAKLLKERGYERVTVLADGDAAGKALATKQVETLLKVGFTDIWVLNWGEDNRDISKLYFDTMDPIAARQWIDERLEEPGRRFVKRDNPYLHKPNEDKIVSLSTVRGDGEDSMRQHIKKFLDTYGLMYRRGKGRALHLQAPPGAGKTHVLIETAETIAKLALENLALEKQLLIDSIEDKKRQLDDEPENRMENQAMLERLERRLENFGDTAIAWYGAYKNGWDDLIETGADESLWYNYEARSEENCENFKRVRELGAKNHDIGYFCRTSCPFYQECAKTGYWKQEEERKSKPITFFRHQHLMANHEQDYKYLLIVDEYSGSILENDPICFQAKHIYPSLDGWDLEIVDIEQVQAILEFAEAMRATISSNDGAPLKLPNDKENPDYIVSGAKFLKKLDQHVHSISGKSLADLMESIDRRALHDNYQPHFSGAGEEIVHMRCVPQAYDAIIRELMDYQENPENDYPSCLHLIAGTLEVYAQDVPKLRNKTPLIVADATGMPSLYEAMFKRDVDVYAPVIRNPNARIEVIRGSDYTKSTINITMGAAIKDRKKLIKETVKTVDGEDFDPNQVPLDENLYGAAVMQDLLQATTELSKRHKSLLVVTHKDLKELLESVVQGAWPSDDDRKELTERISFGHYGALRGTNRYKDYEAVLLLGVFRIPYNAVWRRIQMWAWLLGIKEEISPDLVRKDDGLGGSYPTFQHDFADAFVSMLEEGEIQQSAARIRPHSSNDEKYIYLFANRPAMQFVSHITQKKDFLRGAEGSPHEEIYHFMKDFFLKEAAFPSYSILREKFRVSNSTIKRIRHQIEKEK